MTAIRKPPPSYCCFRSTSLPSSSLSSPKSTSSSSGGSPSKTVVVVAAGALTTLFLLLQSSSLVVPSQFVDDRSVSRRSAAISGGGGTKLPSFPQMVFLDPQVEADLNEMATTTTQRQQQRRSARLATKEETQSEDVVDQEGSASSAYHRQQQQCPYSSIRDDLSPEERQPSAGADGNNRYIVDPPRDTKISLVCCRTTAGPLNVAVHHAWAPRGAARFLDMVTSDYFSYRIPLFRCVQDFICQFGLSGEHSHLYAEKIQDDPQWLPLLQRKNDRGVKRFQTGYFAYAGSGPNSRGRQLFVALGESGSLGADPWEVPFGEAVGRHSYETLNRLYTGYGERGPSQNSLVEPGGLDAARRDFPNLDWIVSCDVVDEVVLVNEGEGERAAAAIE